MPWKAGMPPPLRIYASARGIVTPVPLSKGPPLPPPSAPWQPLQFSAKIA